VDKVKLGDIYVYPDIELESENKKKIEIEIVDSEKHLGQPGHFLILAEEQSGKTSLLKRLFAKLALEGKLPIYLDCENINKSDLERVLERQISEQYSNLTIEQFLAFPENVILLDNLDRIGLNNRHRNIFISLISERFGYIIATCHSAFSYISSEIPALSTFKSCELLGLGNFKREEIIKKWISLGVEESIDESSLYSKCDDLKIQLNSIIKKISSLQNLSMY